ncbi:GNAT family N-acetyltransferase [Candidatus Woesearchaeota archaeon]|jgi:[ribosomal protein S5]-alanine N-acetyltransferase|nr:GNAT family N-acetyltransferase [Candidatus Woesearchaeota archaeon]MBT6520072.1 GNAT family N-acetyltransferase [Candidatus Woesearchaeota archaeon]MBT7366677.1 GNAT family N-acetyltransferase [Candidatus Woesearchaeota archaeon]
MKPKLKLGKVEIRKSRMSDATAISKILDDDRVVNNLTDIPSPYTLRCAKKDIENSLKYWKQKKGYAFTIIYDSVVVGQVFLEDPARGMKAYSIGYYIAYDYWGRGIATNAAKLAVKYGFNSLGLKKIWGDNDSDMSASGRVMEKAGFKQEGLMKKQVYRKTSKGKEKYVDLVIWGKINR